MSWTVLEGARASESTLFWLDNGVKSGDIVLRRDFDVSSTETRRSIYQTYMGYIVTVVLETVR
jgi:methionyl-tRNA formyltransferase